MANIADFSDADFQNRYVIFELDSLLTIDIEAWILTLISLKFTVSQLSK